MSPAYTLTLHKCMQLRELSLCWKPGVMPLHVESKAWSDAKTSFRSWPDAFDLEGFIPLFARGGLPCTLRLILRVYMRPYFYDFLSPKYPKPNASLGKIIANVLHRCPLTPNHDVLNGTWAMKQSLLQLSADLLHLDLTAISCNIASTGPVVSSCQSLRVVVSMTAEQQGEYNAIASQQV